MASQQPRRGFSPHLVLRPLFSAITLLSVVLAIVQVSGRLSVAALHLLENNINVMLFARGIEVVGLRGDWQGLNPVIGIEQVHLPAGAASGVDVELDLLESLWRSSLVPRRMIVRELTLDLVQTSQGWRLRGPDQGPLLNLDSLLNGTLRHVDNLDMAATLRFFPQRTEAQDVDLPAPAGQDLEVSELSTKLLLVNRFGRHYLQVELANAGVAGESLQFQGWHQQALPGIAAAVNAGVAQGRLQLPPLWPSMPNVHLEVTDSRWQDSGGFGGGRLNLRVDGLQVGGGEPDEALGVAIGISAQRQEDAVEGVVEQFKVYSTDQELALQDARLSLQLTDQSGLDFAVARQLLQDEPTPPLLRLWMHQLDLNALSQFMASAVDHWQPVNRWVRGLSVTGQARNIHAFFDPDLGMGYRASITELHMQGHKGAPTLENGQGVLWGHNQGMAMQLNAADVGLQFPDLFHEKWAMDHISGVVKSWFAPDYLALEGSSLKARMGDTGIAGTFSLTRPQARSEQRVGVVLNVDQVDLLAARAYIPHKIPPQLATWLAQGPKAGQLRDALFAYQGQVHRQPGEPVRRIELTTNLQQGTVRYDPAWPMVTALQAQVHVAGANTRVAVARGRSLGVALDNTSLMIAENGLYADISLRASGDGADVLSFVRGSPLQENLDFITPQWASSGVMEFAGQVRVPLQEGVDASGQRPLLAADLAIALADVAIAMPEYRTSLTDLNGVGQFSLPHHLQGDFAGELFTQPVQIKAGSDNKWLWFELAGRARPEDVYHLLQTETVAPLSGHFEFDSKLNIAVDGGVTNLEMNSDLQGLQVGLPGEFGKVAEAKAGLELAVQFRQDQQRVRWNYGAAEGWLHVGDTIERGAIGLNQPPPMTAREETSQEETAQEETAIVISGKLPEVVLGDWVSAPGDASVSLPVDWTIRDLVVDSFVVDELAFTQLELSGSQVGDEVSFHFAGEQLEGVVHITPEDMLEIDLDRLHLPQLAEETQEAHETQEALETTAADDSEQNTNGLDVVQNDPLSVEVGRRLPWARVNIAQLTLGETSFGSWRFVMQPQQDQLVLQPFSADVNGVHFADTTVVWDLQQNRSSFVGALTLDDLQETLPKWDYAASLQTTSASMSADANWSGSPANVSLLGLSGQLTLAARDGRFLEVEGGQGGLRILSLINFSKIAKRISFDFSDVVGSGISFDTITANVNLQTGTLGFNEPMVVDSSSGLYRVGGQVDLGSGRLDNEMIVTLPVSNSLPWYGVYLALANPLAGLGVLVGERVLRNPIKQFSTAKFEVSGTLDEPKVDFVSLWDRSIKEPSAEVEPAAGEAAEKPAAEAG